MNIFGFKLYHSSDNDILVVWEAYLFVAQNIILIIPWFQCVTNLGTRLSHQLTPGHHLGTRLSHQLTLGHHLGTRLSHQLTPGQHLAGKSISELCLTSILPEPIRMLSQPGKQNSSNLTGMTRLRCSQ